MTDKMSYTHYLSADRKGKDRHDADSAEKENSKDLMWKERDHTSTVSRIACFADYVIINYH